MATGYEGFIRGAQNLAQALFPNPQEQQRAQLVGARTALTQQEGQLNKLQRQAQVNAARSFYEGTDPRLTMARAAQSGNPSRLAEAFGYGNLYSTALDPESTAAQIIRARSATGETTGQNDAVTLGGREDIRSANAANKYNLSTALQGMREAGKMARTRYENPYPGTFEGYALNQVQNDVDPTQNPAFANTAATFGYAPEAPTPPEYMVDINGDGQPDVPFGDLPAALQTRIVGQNRPEFATEAPPAIDIDGDGVPDVSYKNAPAGLIESIYGRNNPTEPTGVMLDLNRDGVPETPFDELSSDARAYYEANGTLDGFTPNSSGINITFGGEQLGGGPVDAVGTSTDSISSSEPTGRTIYDAAGDATGVVNTAEAAANTATGVFGGVAFPDTAESRNQVRLFNQFVRSNLRAGDGRVSNQEQEWINTLLADPGNPLANPRVEENKYKTLYEKLGERIQSMKAQLQSGSTTEDVAKDLLNNINAYQVIRNRMGEPPSSADLTGSSGELPPGIPEGSEVVGTYNGKPAYKTPDGRYLVVQ